MQNQKCCYNKIIKERGTLLLGLNNKNFEVKSFPTHQSIYGFDILFKKGMIKLGADFELGCWYMII